MGSVGSVHRDGEDVAEQLRSCEGAAEQHMPALKNALTSPYPTQTPPSFFYVGSQSTVPPIFRVLLFLVSDCPRGVLETVSLEPLFRLTVEMNHRV